MPAKRFAGRWPTRLGAARCWAVLDGPTGKRLHAGLPELLANLARHGHLQDTDPAAIARVLVMSPTTIDRRRAPARVDNPGVDPMKIWAEGNDHERGFVQIDLVGQDGGDNNGQFYTLDATDVTTGWTEVIIVRSKGERIVAAGLETLRLRFPFHIARIHSDIGSEGSSTTTSPAGARPARSPSPEAEPATIATKPTSNRRTGQWSAAASATSATTLAANSTCSTSCGR